MARRLGRSSVQGGGSDVIMNRPTSMVFDPTDPNRWWESGNYNGGGVYRTDDAGAVVSPAR